MESNCICYTGFVIFGGSAMVSPPLLDLLPRLTNVALSVVFVFEKVNESHPMNSPENFKGLESPTVHKIYGSTKCI
jgi:hypothetical protein